MKDRLRHIVSWLIPSGDIAERTVKSGIWVSVSRLTGRGLQILLLIILARLLDPADFGLMGIALLTIETAKHLTNLGINDALIRKIDDNIDAYLNTVLTLSVGRSLLITTVVVLIAPVVAGIFGEPRSTTVIRVIGLSPLVLSLKNPGIIYLQKDLEFHKQTIYRLSYAGTRFVVGVGYAIVSPTIWALVVSYIVADVVRVVVSYLVHEYRPWPGFRLSLARELLNYGKWITGGSILYLIYSRGDDAVVGWLLSATSLGFYQVAYEFGLAPGKQLTGVIKTVMFPSFSQLQNDMEMLRRAFFRTVQFVTLLGFPTAVGIVITAPPFVKAFLGSDWMPMIGTIQILAVYGLILTVTSTFSPIWQALDRPDLGTKLDVLKILLIAPLIVPMTSRFGIEGAAMTVVGITLLPMLPLDCYLVINILDVSYTRLVKSLAYPGIASVSMGICVLAVQQAVSFRSPLSEFCILVGVGICSYVIAVGIIVTQFRWNIDRSIRSLLASMN